MILDAIPRRGLNLIGFLICAGLLGFGYYLQFYRGLEPCPMCILQRVGFMTVGILFLLAAIHNPARVGSRIYGVLILAAGLVSMSVSIRHLWLQSLPADQVPDCGPGLSYMLEVFPVSETIRMIFTGSGECAEVSWSFLGLSMPAWALFWFLVLGGVGFFVNSIRK